MTTVPRSAAVTPPVSPSASSSASSSASEARLAALAGVVHAVLGDVTIQDSVPDDASRTVGLVPLGLTRLGRVRNGDTIVQLCLRVLAVTAGPSPLADLESLLVALDHIPGAQVERAEPPLELWSLLNTRPRPAAIVRLDVPITLPSAPGPQVLHPLQIDAQPVVTREGVVVGPDGAALPYGVVRATRYDRAVRSDVGGRFQLPLPAGDDRVALIVEVRGRTFAIDAPVPQQGPILVHCDREEMS